MSEKRFEFYSDDYLIGVLDNVTGKTLNHFATIDLLNEQQATIKQLQDDLKWSEARIKSRNDKIDEQQATISQLKEENEQLRMKLKGEDYIMVSEMLSNLRKTGICDGCKNKDKPVEWYLERGFSITGQICDRYEPEV